MIYEEFLKHACLELGFPVETIRRIESKTRKRIVVDVRRALIYVFITRYSLDLKYVSDMLGYADHSMALYHRDEAISLIESKDSGFNYMVRKIESILHKYEEQNIKI